ncbi:MAG: cupin domain-containing protein [Bacteroidetes bacterium]|nr:cupin domain-containing protein [Bacteroidota bacterium]
MKSILFLLMFLPCFSNAQSVFATDTLNIENTGKTQVSKLYCDSLSCTFLIIIPDEVKAHYHATHTENIFVLEGNAIMKLGKKEIEIKKGDLIIVPAKTVHSVLNQGNKPLKVISVQSPFFDGNDRILIDN